MPFLPLPHPRGYTAVESAWGHNGDIPGFSTRLGFTPNGAKGIVMAQTTLTGGGPAEALSDRAIDRVICG